MRVWWTVIAVAAFTSAAKDKTEFSLEDVKRRTFAFFWDLAHPVTGLIPDRAPTMSFASIAAHGFGLTAYLIGVENGYIGRAEAAKQVLTSLKFLYELPQSDDPVNSAGYKGFFYHFLHMGTGLRFEHVELSTIDTALLMAGVLTCLTYFDSQSEAEREIRKYAEQLYLRVEWDWFLYKDTKLLSMGWTPEQGFLSALWSGYNEGMILYILALGSPTTKLMKSDSWTAWTRTYRWGEYKGQEHLNFGPLFGHQYSQMFIDFRDIKDQYMESKGIDYFINSRRATLANREYCRENSGRFKQYSEEVWGLTACDGPGEQTHFVNGEKTKFFSYRARGAALGYEVDDGTVSPTAAGGSIPFAPAECIGALRAMYRKYGEFLYSKYGFKDAFNPSFVFGGSGGEYGWFGKDYIGIDQGPILIQIQNHQTEFVWKLLQRNPYIRAGLKSAGFTGGWIS